MQSSISFTCRTTPSFRILKYIFLLIIWCNKSSSGRVSKVKIIRSIDGQVDRIRFPRQLCGTTRAQDVGCDVMQKRKGQSCSCTCNVTNPSGTPFVKHTVVYNNGSWQCLNNSQVRQLAGCKLLYVGEGIIDPIPEISRKPYYVLKTEPGERCRVNAMDSTFLKCNGAWKPLRESVLRRFVNTSSRFTKDQVVIKYIGATKSHATVDGRVIRLVVSCRKKKKNRNVGCIVMKVKGKLRCPLVVSTKGRSKPTNDSEVSNVTTASRIVKRNPMLTSPKPTDGINVSIATKASSNVIRKPAESPLVDLQRPKVGANKKNLKKRGEVVDETFLHSLAVNIGAFAVVILVIVIVSTIVVKAMRRKLNNFGGKSATVKPCGMMIM